MAYTRIKYQLRNYQSIKQSSVRFGTDSVIQYALVNRTDLHASYRKLPYMYIENEIYDSSGENTIPKFDGYYLG